MAEIILRTEDITKRFPLPRKERKTGHECLTAVDRVSLSLRKGEIYGLLGPNGAGKTTTLRMIGSLIAPDEGSIIYENRNINEDLMGYRSKIGFLTAELKQDGFFSPDYLFDFMSELHRMPKEESRERKERLFQEFGIAPFRDKRIETLSTGMKQKASLALALVNDPDLVIFDEPTNGLDILGTKAVEDFLRSLRTKGRTILLSTHIFSLVEKLCDRVGVLLEGRLVKEGTLDEVRAGKSLEDSFFDLLGERRGA